MQTQAWTRKDLHTALGSWTELKHDTILYAKQVMAEMGGGGDEKPPHSYVEPNPEAYARLLALATMTRDGLQQRGLLSDVTRGNLDNLISELQFLQRISEAEMNGTEISDDDYWHMFYWGGTLEQFTLAAADTDPGGGRPILEDQKAALIADVATGLAADGTLVRAGGSHRPADHHLCGPARPAHAHRHRRSLQLLRVPGAGQRAHDRRTVAGHGRGRDQPRGAGLDEVVYCSVMIDPQPRTAGRGQPCGPRYISIPSLRAFGKQSHI